MKKQTIKFLFYVLHFLVCVVGITIEIIKMRSDIKLMLDMTNAVLLVLCVFGLLASLVGIKQTWD